MLIIALPKSASTSLLRTLARLSQLPGKQHFFPEQKWPAAHEFDAMARFHSDVREITAEQADLFTADDRWAKQHLVPTANNESLVGEARFVLLTREPAEIVLAYRRWEATGESPPRIEFKGLTTEEQWLERAQDIGIIAEFERFSERWRTHPGCLEVSYRELLSSTDGAFDRIEDWFGMARSSRPVELARERFTREAKPAPAKPARFWTRRK